MEPAIGPHLCQLSWLDRLGNESFISACKHLSRSACMAEAVMAMMGMPGLLAADSFCRMARMASKPSISGIWQSISTRIVRFGLQSQGRLKAIGHYIGLVAQFFWHIL